MRSITQIYISIEFRIKLYIKLHVEQIEDSYC